MANVKDLSRKINSLRNMQKVTRAMNMIATIKLRKLFSLQDPLDKFSSALDGVTSDIIDALGESSHPVIAGYNDRRLANIIIFTADKGLCGSHNNSIHKELALYIQELKKAEVEADVTCFGLKGANFCRRKEYSIFHQAEINDRSLGLQQLRQISRKLFDRFRRREIQEVTVIYNRFINTLQQETVVRQLLPIHVESEDDAKKSGGELEPDPDAFAESAAELYLYYSLCIALYNSYLSEHASRMTAMENATNNSEDLIGRYVTLQNRARQASITNEIIEIVSGKEAMKG